VVEMQIIRMSEHVVHISYQCALTSSPLRRKGRE